MIDRCVENPNHVVGMSLKIPKFVQKLAQFQKSTFLNENEVLGQKSVP